MIQLHGYFIFFNGEKQLLIQNITRCLIMMLLATGLQAYDFPLERGKELNLTVPEIVREASKALVFIAGMRENDLAEEVGPSLLELARHIFPWPRRLPERPDSLAIYPVRGSGFFVDLENGYVVTNAHVVAGNIYTTLKLANGEGVGAVAVVGVDEDTDIAVVQVSGFNPEGFAQLALIDDSGSLEVGESVIALGAPYALRGSVSKGIVSALNRGNLDGHTAVGNFIQTDAALNPGNSGGPLLNMQGRVVGVNTASIDGGDNVGFAVPANIVRQAVAQIIDTRRSAHGYLGITTQVAEVASARDDADFGGGCGTISSSPAASRYGLMVLSLPLLFALLRRVYVLHRYPHSSDACAFRC